MFNQPKVDFPLNEVFNQFFRVTAMIWLHLVVDVTLLSCGQFKTAYRQTCLTFIKLLLFVSNKMVPGVITTVNHSTITR